MAKKIGPARHTKSSFHDREAISIVEMILNRHKLVAPDLKKDDTWPNHDGYLEILNNIGEPQGTLSVQIKTLKVKKTKISHSLDDKFIAYCKTPRENPIIFITVDINQKIAYWHEIDPQIISRIKGKTLVLNEENVITEANNQYHENWLKICKKRQEILAAYHSNKPQRGISQEKANQKEINIAQTKVKKLFVSDELKYKYYYAFVDLLEPIYLNKEGEDKRAKLRGLFDISADQEKEFIKRMVKEKLVKIVGDLCVIQNQEYAIELQGEIMRKGVLDLEIILKLFL